MATPCSSFEVVAQCTATPARSGRLQLAHGVVETPAFMAVGTYGVVKNMDARDLRRLGSQIILSNTFHLHQRPGDERVRDLGGLHSLMAWDGPILTDSGGYQIFSLESLRRLGDHGVRFQSPVDGRLIELTPESVIRIQENLGVDIAMVLDECMAYGTPRDALRHSMERTIAWAKRAVKARGRTNQAVFGIVQGGFEDDLREECIERLSELPFEGLAMGGLSVGEPPEVLHRALSSYGPKMPSDRPRYAMGIGYPRDLVAAVEAGFDMFDCVLPTRNARNGQMFVRGGKINIKNARWKDEPGPVDPSCECWVCGNLSAAYLRHLYVTKHSQAGRFMTEHNLHHYLTLMREMRIALRTGRFPEFVADFRAEQMS